MKIVLRVDRLVLDGIEVTPGSAPRIRAAVERELSRLFANSQSAVRFESGALARIAAPDIRVTRSEPPVSVGRSVGAAVHAGLMQGSTERHR